MLPGWGQIVTYDKAVPPVPWGGTGQGLGKEARAGGGKAAKRQVGSVEVDERKVEGSDIRAKWLKSLQG